MLIRDLGVHKALPLTIPHKGGRVTPKEPGKEAAALWSLMNQYYLASVSFLNASIK